MTYDWPGNIRELKNAVHHAMTVMDSETLDESCLNGFFQQLDKSQNLSILKTNSNRTLCDLEREAIIRALHFSRGNKLEAAKALGIGRATFYRKLKALNALNRT